MNNAKKINKLCLFVRVGGFVCPSVCKNKKKVINIKIETLDEKLQDPESVSVCVIMVARFFLCVCGTEFAFSLTRVWRPHSRQWDPRWALSQ